jgi:Carboxymuconolactone decarboxylase family
MVQLAALIACNAASEYRAMLGAALNVGVTPVEAKEIVYQAVPYVGMGIVFDVLHATNDVLTERGVQLPLPGQATTTPETRAARGLVVQKQIVGDERVDALYANAPDDEQHIQRFLSANCFGDHLTRGSAQVAQLMPEYDGNPAHAFLAMLDRANGLAAGDPARMAARLIESVDVEPAPLRLVLSSQALQTPSTCCASASRTSRASASSPPRPTSHPVSKRLLIPSAALLWGLQSAFLNPALALLLVALFHATAAQVGTVAGVATCSRR